MSVRNLMLGIAAMVSFEAAASPIAGTWQGPCEVRSPRSVKFTYEFSATDAEGNGTLAKIKIYYDDDACSVYNRTGRATVTYALGAQDEAGWYPLDVNHRGALFYDIAALSEDGKTLSFGAEDSRDPATRPTELSTTDRVFTKVED